MFPVEKSQVFILFLKEETVLRSFSCSMAKVDFIAPFCTHFDYRPWRLFSTKLVKVCR
ncbi:unnamed protein product [Angiostrongylus costaricensis]|uniref:Uncharacterized protein n=1 Tax=Angiostrongylus costaricensis TaxID=334426 RepID=A0A0R3PT94_ANGCS|nr:unnamed protein product [Angiostrongylus costaricensis]